MKPPSDYDQITGAYYDAHAAEFCGDTAAVDMADLYAPFVALLPTGGLVLDAGCGSGRDSLYFLKSGYQVIPMDASAEMAKAATALTGQQTLLMTFDSINWDCKFDGIWACASLLHVARQELGAVLASLVNALKPGGVFYMSFKWGDEERMVNGRFFNYLNEQLLQQIVDAQPGLDLLKTWRSEDQRPGRVGELWLNALAQKGRRCAGGAADAAL